MISELLQKQLGKETELIFSEEHHESFLNAFFQDVIKDIVVNLGYQAINVFVSFTTEFVYVQIQYLEEDGYPFIHEGKIYYEQYNLWANGVTNV